MYKGLMITGATLLSIEEAGELPIELRKYIDFWWLKSPGYGSNDAAIVVDVGSVFSVGSRVSDSEGAVRPALQIENLKSSNLKRWSTFIFGGKIFQIISDTLAFCLSDIGTCAFRKDCNAEDANDYEKSDVKKYIDDWFSETIRSCEENLTLTLSNTNLVMKNMKNNYESITFAKNNYDNEEQMWDDIRDTLRILSKQDYQFKFYCDEQGVGVYVLQFNYKDWSMSGVSLDWIGENNGIVLYNTSTEKIVREK